MEEEVEEEEEEEAERVMVSTISFIQANLQHSIAASRILTRTVSFKGIDMALIQELWYRNGCVSSLNIPGYTLYSVGGKGRPRACILVRNMNIWVVLGFSCRDLVAALVKYKVVGQKDGWLSVLLICHMILRILPRLGSWRNLCDIVKMKISVYLWGATPMHITLPGVAPTVMVQGRP